MKLTKPTHVQALNHMKNESFNSDDKEDDSRISYHALKSLDKNILICSQDTDTVHTGLPLIEQYSNKDVVIQLGHQSYIHQLVSCLKSDPDLAKVNLTDLYKIIQLLFVVSGYDYIFFFIGFGKVKFLQIFF